MSVEPGVFPGETPWSRDLELQIAGASQLVLTSGLFLVSAARAVVLVEALLGNAVKCERRNGALQARGG